MKLILSDALLDFFATHQLLELEDLVPPRFLVSTAPPLASWEESRHFLRMHADLESWVLHSALGQIASFLYKRRPIRLAYTALITQMPPPFTTSKTLQEISCIDPILGGVFLSLANTSSQASTPLPDLHHIPSRHGIFVSAHHLIPFPSLCASIQTTLLVVFTHAKPRYKLELQDPCTHELKKSGYAFGDQILEQDAPYLYH